MSVSTATATTATAEPGGVAPHPAPTGYVGRFAPSPSGDLHLGSLVAALASFLDARRHQGRWLVRIEDLDRGRVVPGSADRILRTLEAFGLTWDGCVLHQSGRTELYAEAVASLERQGRVYPCGCSRRELSEQGEAGYPGTCRGGTSRPPPHALRLRVPERRVAVLDRIQGRCELDLGELGDCVVRRRDGCHAYQLAVVVDDAAQGVTDVVRGADLLPSTAWQIELQQALGLSEPRYAHVPLLVEPDGSKLAKSRRTIAVQGQQAPATLALALRLLGQPPPPELDRAPVPALLDWAIATFRCERLSRERIISAPVLSGT